MNGHNNMDTPIDRANLTRNPVIHVNEQPVLLHRVYSIPTRLVQGHISDDAPYGPNNTPSSTPGNTESCINNRHISIDNTDNETKNKGVKGVSGVSSTICENGDVKISAVYDTYSYTCCVCFDRIVGCIISCDNGHPICEQCNTGIASSRDDRCPICRSSSKGRNYLLEMALSNILVSCPFSKHGCTRREYPENIESHASMCIYAEIDCPWCMATVTPFDLNTHAEFKCESMFSEIKCSGRIDFIISDKVNNIYIVSALDSSRILYIQKKKNTCRLLCIYASHTENIEPPVVLSYSSDSKSQVRKTLNIRVHRPEHLIHDNIVITNIPLTDLAEWHNITIAGFGEKYTVGSRWMLVDICNALQRVTITRRTYIPEMICVKYDILPPGTCDEWIALVNGESSRIRGLDENNGRTTSEDIMYLNNLSDADRLTEIMERSMNEY